MPRLVINVYLFIEFTINCHLDFIGTVHYNAEVHEKTECNYGEGVEGGARCPAYGFGGKSVLLH